MATFKIFIIIFSNRVINTLLNSKFSTILLYKKYTGYSIKGKGY